MKLLLSYRESQCGGDAIDPSDRWSGRTDEVIEFEPICFEIDFNKKEFSWYKEQIEIDFEPKIGDEIVLMTVRYSTGDTFGTTTGAWKILGAFKPGDDRISDVPKLIHKHETMEHEVKWHSRSKTTPTQAALTKAYDTMCKALGELPNGDCHPCWVGYFERLESIDIVTLRVEEHYEY